MRDNELDVRSDCHDRTVRPDHDRNNGTEPVTRRPTETRTPGTHSELDDRPVTPTVLRHAYELWDVWLRPMDLVHFAVAPLGVCVNLRYLDMDRASPDVHSISPGHWWRVGVNTKGIDSVPGTDRQGPPPEPGRLVVGAVTLLPLPLPVLGPHPPDNSPTTSSRTGLLGKRKFPRWTRKCLT